MNSSFNQEIQGISTLILNGDLKSAQDKVDALKPQSEVEQRIRGHFKGVILNRTGRFAESVQTLTATMEAYGENVNLLRDLMVGQYHLQDMSGFRMNLAKLERNLRTHENELSDTTLLSCEILTGKFLEEEGRLAQAMEYFERANRRSLKSANLAHRVRTLVQKARWYGLYQPNTDLSVFYRDLISLNLAEITRDLRVEVEHSLMLIELRVIGADHAWHRVLNNREAMDEIDRRLLCFDFIEGCLTQDLPLPKSVFEIINQFESLDPFEDYLKSLIEEKLEPEIKIQKLTSLASQLPWASYMRLLCVTANRETNPRTRQEISRKIRLIVESLDLKSQALWKSRLKEGLDNNEIKVDYLVRRRSIAVQGRSIDLSKKKISLQLLEGLAKNSALSIDEAIELLWESTFTPEHYHRLRMGVHRLNVLVHKATGLGKIIEVDSQSVRLRPEVKLRRHEESVEAQLLGV